jgi:glutamate-1-semialdehyde aminotransferase
LDYICGLGCNLFGYGNDRIGREIVRHAFGGASHSLPTVHEVEAAEAVKSMFPFIDLVKFCKTGSLACDAAIKIARAYTGRSLVLSDGYHGHGDDFVSLTPPADGVPKRDWVAPLVNMREQITEDVAAVIVEPVIVDHGPGRVENLKKLRQLCTEKGVVLIFDEVITGFRFNKYGVSNCYGIHPDLICLGKAMANGMPLACVGGSKDLMSGNYFISSTYGGEVLSLASCKAAIGLLQTDNDYNINRLWVQGQEFLDKFNEIGSGAGIQIKGYPTRGVFEGDPEKIAQYFQEMGKAHTLFCKSWFFNFCLPEHTDNVLQITKEIMFNIQEGKVRLQYPMPVAPYAAKVRQ